MLHVIYVSYVVYTLYCMTNWLLIISTGISSRNTIIFPQKVKWFHSSIRLAICIKRAELAITITYWKLWMTKMFTQSISILLLLLLVTCSMVFVNSLPIDSSRLMKRSTAINPSAAVTMPKTIRNMLTNIRDGAEGLYSIYSNAGFLGKKEFYKV